jgi:hypothetical protein
VLSGRGLCDGLIARPEVSYRLWRVVVRASRNLENEEAKARYWAVENTTRWVVTPRKQTIPLCEIRSSHRPVQTAVFCVVIPCGFVASAKLDGVTSQKTAVLVTLTDQ